MTTRLHLVGPHPQLHPCDTGSAAILRIPCLRALFLLGVCVIFATKLYAAPETFLKLSEYQKQDWQVEDGLPDNNLRMVGQRSNGLLLLATSSGLATFDGQRFHGLPLEIDGLVDNEAVNAFLPGLAGDLWIGTDGRGLLHQTALGTVAVSEAAGFHNERIRMLYRDVAGVLWIATQNGIERLVHDHLELVAGAGMISGDITAPFAEDGAGGMFFVTFTGLSHWQNGAARPYPLKMAPADKPVAVYRDLQQRLWVGTMNHLVELVPRRCPPCDAAPGAMPLYDSVVRATIASPVTVLLGDRSGVLWLGTRHDGLWRLAPDGLSHWSSADGLPDNSVRTLFIDDEQNLWIGMLSGGLSRWHKGVIAPFGEAEGLPATYAANVLADSKGDLWLGTWGKGLFRVHNGKVIPFNPPSMPITTPIRSLAEDRKGHLWIGTWFEGIYRYDGRSFQHFLLWKQVSRQRGQLHPCRPEHGGLWVGTYTGLFYFPGGEPDLRHHTELIHSQLITCMIEDRDGSILVGTSTGLYRIRDGAATEVQGLSRPYILSLVLDSQGYAWAGTKAGGLALVQDGKILPLPGARANIPPFPVSSAIEDKDGHLWLGTYRGIVRLSVTDLHAVADDHEAQLSAVILGKADGMRSSECGGPSKPGAARLPDGTLWFATEKGFAHTTDMAEKLSDVQPTASITGWTMSNDPDAETVATAPDSRIDLKAGQDDVLFLFNAKLLSNPAHVEYRYRLVGYDADWTATRAHFARYRRLPSGPYQFQVQAHASGEGWTSPIASIDLKQQPYLYATWYFYLIVCLLTVFVAIQLFRRRVQLMRGQIGVVVEERNRIARECHDTLMAGFAAISWQLEATAKLFRDTDTSATPAAKSCELARSMVSHCQAEARRIIWDLRETEEVTDTLSEALGRALATNPMQQSIETTFEVEGDEQPLSPGCVHHLVCIGQEAVSNAMRHAEPSRILVLLKYEVDALSLSVHDNGRGFHGSLSGAAKHGHFGIPVMEERARKLGGTLRLQTSAEVGTEVTVKVSFSAMRQPAHQQHHVIRWIGI